MMSEESHKVSKLFPEELAYFIPLTLPLDTRYFYPCETLKVDVDGNGWIDPLTINCSPERAEATRGIWVSRTQAGFVVDLRDAYTLRSAVPQNDLQLQAGHGKNEVKLWHLWMIEPTPEPIGDVPWLKVESFIYDMK